MTFDVKEMDYSINLISSCRLISDVSTTEFTRATDMI